MPELTRLDKLREMYCGPNSSGDKAFLINYIDALQAKLEASESRHQEAPAALKEALGWNSLTGPIRVVEESATAFIAWSIKRIAELETQVRELGGKV